MQLHIDENVMAKALYAHSTRRRVLRYVLWGVVAFTWLMCFVIYLVQGVTLLLGLVLLLTLLVLVLVTPLLIPVYRFMLKRQFRQMAAKGDDVSKVTVTYDNTAITFTTKKSSNRTEWSAFTAYTEKDNLLLLYRNKSFFFILPLNQISDADQSAIQDYVNNYIPEPE